MRYARRANAARMHHVSMSAQLMPQCNPGDLRNSEATTPNTTATRPNSRKRAKLEIKINKVWAGVSRANGRDIAAASTPDRGACVAIVVAAALASASWMQTRTH